METKVTLVSWTNNPLETIFSVWEASKTEGKFRAPIEIKEQVSSDEIEKLFRAVIAQNIPVGEHVDFVFMLEGVSVSWREQAVRHRIGTLPSPERVGVDIVMETIPKLVSSSWWSQSMRIMDMGSFADKEMYRVPDTIANNLSLLESYKRTMAKIQDTYVDLVNSGVPMEDARELIPLGAQHRISWKLNIGSLRHIVGERGCWILQLGIWGPVIQGMINELATKVHPIFREFITPPCIKGDSFEGCIYKEECRRRLDGEDKLPPCPLHMNYHYYGYILPELMLRRAKISNIPMVNEMEKRAEEYRLFWGRDPYSGRKEV